MLVGLRTLYLIAKFHKFIWACFYGTCSPPPPFSLLTRPPFAQVVRVPDHVRVMDSLCETPHLLREISSANGVLFLGSGFSIPAKLQGWADLLRRTAKEAQQFAELTGGDKKIPVDCETDIVADTVEGGEHSALVRLRVVRQRGPREAPQTLTQVPVSVCVCVCVWVGVSVGGSVGVGVSVGVGW